MNDIYKISSLNIEATCCNISIKEWNKLMKNSAKANGFKIRKLIKKHIPELYESLNLDYYNPFENQCKRTKTHFIYVHSGIEYFLKFEKK